MNTNCLEGMKCPKCGQGDEFKITIEQTMLLADTGVIDVYGDHEYDGNSFCRCPACDYRGWASDFWPEEVSLPKLPGISVLYRIEKQTPETGWYCIRKGITLDAAMVFLRSATYNGVLCLDNLTGQATDQHGKIVQYRAVPYEKDDDSDTAPATRDLLIKTLSMLVTGIPCRRDQRNPCFDVKKGDIPAGMTKPICAVCEGKSILARAKAGGVK